MEIIKEDLNYEEIFKSLALCHTLKTKYNPKYGIISNEWNLSYSRCITEFAEKCGYKFEACYRASVHKTKIYEITINGDKKEFYPILAINEVLELNIHKKCFLVGI